jgi:hypothetical protein
MDLQSERYHLHPQERLSDLFSWQWKKGGKVWRNLTRSAKSYYDASEWKGKRGLTSDLLLEKAQRICELEGEMPHDAGAPKSQRTAITKNLRFLTSESDTKWNEPIL